MGLISMIGIGPGRPDQLTAQAVETIKNADVICGYTVYVDLIRDLISNQLIYTTPMKQETERCRWAIEQAEQGKRVALVCSGDAGVYGMAGLVHSLAQGKEIELQVIPGITAALSGAALLGAPLVHDFCTISLSDLLTPWEVIERRIIGAGMADFVVCLYNPMSHKRTTHLKRACDLLLQYKSPETICGLACNIGRNGEHAEYLTLAELREKEVDMFTTVFVGNHDTRMVDGRMVTPRGYEV